MFSSVCESTVTSVIAFILAVALVETLLPAFNGVAETNLSFGDSTISNALPLLVLSALFVGLLAGRSPAFDTSFVVPPRADSSSGVEQVGVVVPS